MNICVIGTGYVGLNTSAALAYIGHNVIGIDCDPNKVSLLNNGVSPISEYGLNELLALSDMHNHLSFTTRYEGVNRADVVFIAVGTPSNKDGSANMSYVDAVVNSIIESLKSRVESRDKDKDILIVVKSTVPIGTNEAIKRKILESVAESEREHIHFASNPEFLREGCALSDTFYPDRIVVGSDDEVAYKMMSEVYKPLLEQSFKDIEFLKRPECYKNPEILMTDFTSAEMIKYASNTFLALKISYANEIAGLSEKLGANMKDISKGMGMDKRIAPYFLNSGLGWGGSCFPKDTLALLSMAKDYNYSMRIVQATVDVNNSRIGVLVEKLLNRVHTLNGKKIAVLGLTFKPETDDVRNSLAVDLCKDLKRRGASVHITDPQGLENARVIYKDEGFVLESDVNKVIENADALIIATDWKEYKSLNYKELIKHMHNKYILDARNILTPDQIKSIKEDAIYDHM